MKIKYLWIIFYALMAPVVMASQDDTSAPKRESFWKRTTEKIGQVVLRAVKGYSRLLNAPRRLTRSDVSSAALPGKKMLTAEVFDLDSQAAALAKQFGLKRGNESMIKYIVNELVEKRRGENRPIEVSAAFKLLENDLRKIVSRMKIKSDPTSRYREARQFLALVNKFGFDHEEIENLRSYPSNVGGLFNWAFTYGEKDEA